jgi:hypothetical protein
MSEIQDAVIQGHLRTLKMPGIRAEYTQIARQAREDSWSYEEYLRELLDTGNTGPPQEDFGRRGFRTSKPWNRSTGRPWRG